MSTRAIFGASGEDGQFNLKILTMFFPYLICLKIFQKVVDGMIMADDNGKTFKAQMCEF